MGEIEIIPPRNSDLVSLVEAGRVHLPMMVVCKGLMGEEVSHVYLTPGDNLAEKLMEVSPDRWSGSAVRLFRNSTSATCEIDLATAPQIIVAKLDLFVVRVTPGEQVIPIAAVAAVALAVGVTAGIPAALLVGGMMVGTYLVSRTLMQTPKFPSTSQPNQQLSGTNPLAPPTNTARLRDRMPEVFGLMRVWPDLALPSYEDWNETVQYVECVYCLGIGEFDLRDYKIEDSPLENLQGFTATVFPPGSLIPDDVKVVRVNKDFSNVEIQHGTYPDDYTDWVTVLGDRVDEIWWDAGFPKGLTRYRSSGGQAREHIELQYRLEQKQADGSFLWIDEPHVPFEAQKGSQLRYTNKIKVEQGGGYRIKFRVTANVTSTVDDISVHDVQIVSVSSVQYLPEIARNTHETTMIRMQVTNNTRAAPGAELQFNCVAQRKLPALNLSTLDYDPTTLVATRKVCDAIMYTVTSPLLGRYPVLGIDRLALASIQKEVDQIDGGEGGLFDGVFDQFITIDEQLQDIGSVIRTAVIQDAGTVTFVRDARKSVIKAMFNRRNRLLEDDGARTLVLASPDDYDGVEISWSDGTDGWKKKTYSFPENITLLNPKQINGLGLTLWSKVWRRANFEMARQRYRRRTTKVSSTEEGQLVEPLDVIAVVDPWVDTIQDGEVVWFDVIALTVGLSFSVDLPGSSSIRLRRDDGQLVDVVDVVSPPGRTNVVQLARAPVFPIHGPTQEDQLGTLCDIGTSQDRYATLWMAGEIEPGPTSTTISCIEYDDVLYNSDYVPLPGQFRLPIDGGGIIPGSDGPGIPDLVVVGLGGGGVHPVPGGGGVVTPVPGGGGGGTPVPGGGGGVTLPPPLPPPPPPLPPPPGTPAALAADLFSLVQPNFNNAADFNTEWYGHLNSGNNAQFAQIANGVRLGGGTMGNDSANNILIASRCQLTGPGSVTFKTKAITSSTPTGGQTETCLRFLFNIKGNGSAGHPTYLSMWDPGTTPSRAGYKAAVKGNVIPLYQKTVADHNASNPASASVWPSDTAATVAQSGVMSYTVGTTYTWVVTWTSTSITISQTDGTTTRGATLTLNQMEAWGGFAFLVSAGLQVEITDFHIVTGQMISAGGLLTSFKRWPTTSITYAFPAAGYTGWGDTTDAPYVPTPMSNDWSEAPTAMKNAYREIFADLGAKSGLSIQEATIASAQIKIAVSNVLMSMPFEAYTLQAPRGAIFFRPEIAVGTWQPGTYEYQTGYHEACHAMALVHPPPGSPIDNYDDTIMIPVTVGLPVFATSMRQIDTDAIKIVYDLLGAPALPLLAADAPLSSASLLSPSR